MVSKSGENRGKLSTKSRKIGTFT